jgi:DNA-binding transcriptional LysR family regulator
VATHGGFGVASRRTGRPKATLSRRVMDLEDSLGVRLFERGGRSLRLTEEGLALFTRTESLLNEIQEAGEVISAGLNRPRGRLRVSAPLLFSHVAMGRVAASFCATYPEVQLEVTAEDRPVDLVHDGYDVVVRINPRPEAGLVGRCFLKDQMLVAAAPQITRPAAGEAATRPAVVMAGGAVDPVWTYVGDGGETRLTPRPVLTLSSLIMVRDAVRAGAGIALLPRSILSEDLAAKRLVIWGASKAPETEIWVLHTSRRLVGAKVRAFVQHLCDGFQGGVLA